MGSLEKKNKSKPIQSTFNLQFQIKYCVVVVMVSFCSSLALYLYLDRSLGEGYLQILRTLTEVDNALAYGFFLTFFVQTFFFLLLTIVINLFVSHKIAGPVYRFENSLSKIKGGDLRSEVYTRDGDQLKSMVGTLNGFIDSLRDVFGRSREVCETLQSCADGNGGDLGEIRQELARLPEALEGGAGEARGARG